MGKLITYKMCLEANEYNSVNENMYNLSEDGSIPYRSTSYWIGDYSNDYDYITMSYMDQHKSSSIFSWWNQDMLLIAPFAYGYKLGTTSSGGDFWGTTYTYLGPGIPFSTFRTGVNNRPTNSIRFPSVNDINGNPYSGAFYYLAIPATSLTMPSGSGPYATDRYKHFNRLLIIPAKGYLDGGSNNTWNLNISAFSSAISSDSGYKFCVVYFEMYIKNTTTNKEMTAKGWMLGSNYTRHLFPIVFHAGYGSSGGGRIKIIQFFDNFDSGQSFTYSIRLTGIQTGYTTVANLNEIKATNRQLTIGSSGWRSDFYSTVNYGGTIYNLCWEFRYSTKPNLWRVEIEYYIKSDPYGYCNDYYVYDRNGGYKRNWSISLSGSSNPGSTISYNENRFSWGYIYPTVVTYTIGITRIYVYCNNYSAWGFSSTSTTYTTEFLKTIYQYQADKSGWPYVLNLGTYNNKTIQIRWTGHG